MAETVLRFLPVASGMRTAAVTAQSPMFHFTPNRDFLFSRDWDMAMVNRGHINNAGFVNDQNYRRDEKTPLLAIVGDSYVEAAMVPSSLTVQGRLAKDLAGKLRVYSFGASGAPLSQYLSWAGHAVRDWGASAVVINVVGNDFDESVAGYSDRPGFWIYARGPEGFQLRLIPYNPGLGRDIVLHSALTRYLFFNLNLATYWFDLRSLFVRAAAAATRYAGNTAADTSETRMKDSLDGIDAFFRDFPKLVGLPPDRVLFTIDGFRTAADSLAGAGSYFDLMRKAFMMKAGILGYETIDLDTLFLPQNHKTGEVFQYQRDGHWNPAGHEIAYRAVMSSRLMKQILRK
jgi:hypothetical protein